MSASLKRRLRAAIGAVPDDPSRQALYAVVNKCEQLRLEGGHPLQVAANYAIADEFEQVIARAFGIAG